MKPTTQVFGIPTRDLYSYSQIYSHVTAKHGLDAADTASKPSKKARITEHPDTPPTAVQKDSRFLSLPAGMLYPLLQPDICLTVTELRNRIYDFARDTPIEEMTKVPLLLQNRPKPAIANSARGFLAFTQTCRQIRAEYRPIWMRNSYVCIDFDDFEAFVDTFCPIQFGMTNAL
jgi:hypothetical protein